MTKAPTAVSRRRGEELQRAVYEAAVAELIATGYGALTMDRVAARARCGKAVLYRRWPSKRELVLAALDNLRPPLPTGRRDLTARQNLLAVFGSLTDLFVGNTPYPGLFIMSQLLNDHDVRTRYAESVVAPRMKVIDAIIADGVASGEIDPSTVTNLTTRTGPALIVQQVLLTGTGPTRHDLEQIVDALFKRSATQPAEHKGH